MFCYPVIHNFCPRFRGIHTVNDSVRTEVRGRAYASGGLPIHIPNPAFRPMETGGLVLPKEYYIPPLYLGYADGQSLLADNLRARLSHFLHDAERG